MRKTTACCLKAKLEKKLSWAANADIVYTNWKDATVRFSTHEASSCHKERALESYISTSVIHLCAYCICSFIIHWPHHCLLASVATGRHAKSSAERQQAQMREQMERQRERDELEKMCEQMEMLRKLMEESEESRTRPMEGEAKLVKLTEQDDIESYLTTFQWIMRAYEVKEEPWALKIAPQLTGKAQQAYVAMKAEDAGNYQVVKEAILRRYDISEQTYRRCDEEG